MKALSLDPKLGEAHAALSFIKLNIDGDLQAAEREGKLAIELSPNDAQAHVRYSNVLMARHRLDEAIAEVKRAQLLDPLNSQAQQHIAMWFRRNKDYDRAIQENRKAIELEPNSSLFHGALAQTYHDAGRYPEALAEARRAYELSGDPLNRSQIAHMLAHLGKTDEAEKIIEEIKGRGKSSVGSSYNIAKTYATLKRKEETLKWLEYAHEVFAMPGVNMGLRSSGVFTVSEDEEFDWLRSDPRFQDLVKRIGSEILGGTAQPDQK